MIIYVDVVFIVNIIIDFILLMSVSVILTRNAKLKRILLGSIFGGGTTFLLFIKINWIGLTILKIIFGLVMIVITFGFKNLKYTVNNMYYLLTTSFMIGGVMYLLKNKVLYNYVGLVLLFMIVVYLYVKQLKKYHINYSNYYKVQIFINNNKYILTGFLDTGNKLSDPYKHRPVIVIDKKIKCKLNNIIYVPYKSLNNTSVLKCVKTDKVIINNHLFKNYLVGFSKDKIQIDGVDCILHSEMKGDLNA